MYISLPISHLISTPSTFEIASPTAELLFLDLRSEKNELIEDFAYPVIFAKSPLVIFLRHISRLQSAINSSQIITNSFVLLSKPLDKSV